MIDSEELSSSYGSEHRLVSLSRAKGTTQYFHINSLIKKLAKTISLANLSMQNQVFQYESYIWMDPFKDKSDSCLFFFSFFSNSSQSGVAVGVCSCVTNREARWRLFKKNVINTDRYICPCHGEVQLLSLFLPSLYNFNTIHGLVEDTPWMYYLMEGILQKLRKVYRKGETGMNRLSEDILFPISDFKNINTSHYTGIQFSQEGYFTRLPVDTRNYRSN